MKSLFSTWRSELEAELVEAENEMIAAGEAHRVAIACARDARITRDALVEAINRIGGGPIAGALARRSRGIEAPDNQAQAELVKAKHHANNVHERIQDLRLALFQIDTIDPPAPAEAPIIDRKEEFV